MHPIRSARPAALATLAALGALGALAACADSPVAPLSSSVDPAFKSEGRGVLHRYVAIGTSVSMGWRSDGVNLETQATSWPALLAELGHREMSLPLIEKPGCGAPLAAPLASGVRISGEAAAAPFSSRICSPNVVGVELPAQNVAINGARTIHALTATPENPDPNNDRLYARVLAPGMSQVTAMEALNPKLVSVELGANEVLGARAGHYLPGVNVVPVGVWEQQYLQLLDRVEAEAKHVLLVGLIRDAASFPSFRTGAELWDARATFAPFNVAVSPDCMGSQNVLFVAVRVPLAAAQGAALARAGQGPATLSCMNFPPAGPDGPITDYVLSPAELAMVNAQLAAMNAIIAREARERGFAHFELGALYEEANVKAPFNAITLMTSQQPYGPLISLDGIHPSAAGAAVLAEAAAAALDERYGFGILGSSPLAAASIAR